LQKFDLLSNTLSTLPEEHSNWFW